MHPSSSAQVTPEIRRQESQLAEKSKVITWLSEKKRSAARPRFNFPNAKTPTGSRLLSHTFLRSKQLKYATRPNAEDLEATWTDVVNKTWHIHKVSPLHGFSFEPSALKAYSKFLSAHMEAVSSDKAVGVGEDVGNVQIKASKNKEFVEIMLKNQLKEGRDSQDTLLTAILFCAKSEKGPGDLHESFTLLPLMLAKGNSKLIFHLITWWQIQFDSCITQFLISPLQLLWLATMFAECTTDQRSRPVEFVYKVPEEVKGLTTIKYRINAEDCQRIWQNIHSVSAQEDIIRSEEVVSFISALDEHFYHHFAVHLQAMQLLTIGTSVLHVSNDGRLKIFSLEHVQQVVKYLAQEAVKQNLAL